MQKFGSIITSPIRKKNTVRAYRWIIDKFCADFGEEDLAGLSSEKILQFFNIVTNGCKPQTKRVRFSHLVGIYLRPHDFYAVMRQQMHPEPAFLFVGDIWYVPLIRNPISTLLFLGHRQGV